MIGVVSTGLVGTLTTASSWPRHQGWGPRFRYHTLVLVASCGLAVLSHRGPIILLLLMSLCQKYLSKIFSPASSAQHAYSSTMLGKKRRVAKNVVCLFHFGCHMHIMWMYCPRSCGSSGTNKKFRMEAFPASRALIRNDFVAVYRRLCQHNIMVIGPNLSRRTCNLMWGVLSV